MHARFFIGEKAEGADEITISDKEICRQITRVLRKHEGDTVNILDNTGFEFGCVIKAIKDNGIILKIKSKILNSVEPAVKVALYQSLLKKDKMEWVFEKCTEIGVSSFVPMLSEHSVKLSVNFERARKILKESAEQCGRGRVPELEDVISYQEAIARAKASGSLNVLLHNQDLSADSFPAVFGGAQNINLFVGPEGGFSDSEVALARAGGFKILSISPRILRAETAAVAGSFLCFISPSH